MPRKLKTQPAVSSERITSDRRTRVNPIPTLNTRTLSRIINAWESGYLSEPAQVFHAIETRDETLVSLAPQRYAAPSRLPWDILIVEGESENPDALRQRAAALYFYNNLRATSVTDLNIRGSLSLFLRHVAHAIGHRYAAHEVVWQPRDPVWDVATPLRRREGDARRQSAAATPIVRAGLTAEYRLCPLWFFENTTSKLRYLPFNGATQGDEMPDTEWFVSVGQGLLLASAINNLFQRMTLNDWLQFNKDFGAGFLDVSTTATKDSADWTGLKNDIAALFRAKGLLHGTGTTVTYEGPASGQAVFDALLERLEKRVIRMWTGSELSVKAGPTDAVGATNQLRTTDAILESDALWLEEQLHEGVTMPVLRWWFGDDVVPLVYFKLITPSKQNVELELKKDEFLIKSGAKIQLGKLAEKYGATVENGDEFASAPSGQPGGLPLPTPGRDEPPARPFQNESADNIDAETRTAVASALAAANKPLADRLDVLLAFDDEAAFRAELAAILKDEPQLAAAILGSPDIQRMARAEANGMAAHLLNSLSEKISGGKMKNLISPTISFANEQGSDLPDGVNNGGMIGMENEATVGADNWVCIAPYGDHPYRLGDQNVIQRFDREAADAMVAWFNSLAGKVTRLFQGIPLFNGHPDDPSWAAERRAAGESVDERVHGKWPVLEARDNGLWGQLKPEPSGKALVNERIKVKLSPRWFASDKPVAEENGVPVFRPIVLASVGLTNNPNIKGAPTLPLLNEEPENHKEKTGMKDLLLFIATCLGFANEAPADGQEAKPDFIAKLKGGIKSMSEKAQKADSLTLDLANEKRDRTADVDRLNGELETAKTGFANERTARIGDLLGAAITSGRITAADKTDWERRLKLDFANESVALGKLAAKVKTSANAQPGAKPGSLVDADTQSNVIAIQGFINEELKKLPTGTKRAWDIATANARKAHPEAFEDKTQTEE
jgi:hypothetical protein